jgi:hypothetical protein
MLISGGDFSGCMPNHGAVLLATIRSMRRIRAAAAAELRFLRLTSSLWIRGANGYVSSKIREISERRCRPS